MPRKTDVHEVMYGSEPEIPKTQAFFDARAYNMFLHKSFDWYNNCTKDLDKKKWVVSWAVQNGFNANDVKLIPEAYLSTIGSMVRLTDNGFVFNSGHKERMFSIVSNLVIQFKDTTPKMKRIVPDKIGLQMTDFDNAIDAVMDGEKYPKLSITQSLSAPNVNELKAYYTHQFEELEAGSKFTKVYKEILALLTKPTKVVVRKPRVKKSVPPSKQVSKLNFLKADKDLGVKSIKPEKIVGAVKLVVFNTNNRKLTVFHADDQKLGLQVKGSTLLNFTEDSGQKTIRQPENKLTEFVSAPRVKTDKIFDQIKAVQSSVTGRINKHCLLIKVF